MLSGHYPQDLHHLLSVIVEKRDRWMRCFEDSAQGYGVEVEVIARSGEASATIIETAEELDVGMVVLGSSGATALRRLFVGSTAKRVIRKVQRPVLAVPHGAHVQDPGKGGSFDRILFPTDLSESCVDGFGALRDIIARTQATATLAHVLSWPLYLPTLPGEAPIAIPQDHSNLLSASTAACLDDQAARLDAPGVEKVLEIHANAAQGIAAVAEKQRSDLVLIARHGEHSIGSLLFGQTAETVVGISPVPVLVFTPRAST